MKAKADWMAVDVYYERADFELARMSLKNYLDISQKILSTPRYKVSESEALAYADIKEGRIDSAKARLSEMKSHLTELIPFFRDWFKNEHDSLHAEVLLAEGSIEEAIAVGKKFSARKFPGGIRSVTITGINFPILHDVLARAYQKKGEFDKAIAEYEKLITFDPESDDQRLIHPKYHYRLAKLYEQKGWEGKAIEHYEKFLELWKYADPGIAEVEDAKKRLAGLQIP
jgi:tetratricopeptide (TPR) repeat protein